MIADVRLKVRWRLAELIKRLEQEYYDTAGWRTLFRMAPHNAEVARQLKVLWRAKVQTAFPGCEVTYTPWRISLRLPDTYPTPQVPITEPYPRVLLPALFGVPSQEPF